MAICVYNVRLILGLVVETTRIFLQLFRTAKTELTQRSLQYNVHHSYRIISRHIVLIADRGVGQAFPLPLLPPKPAVVQMPSRNRPEETVRRQLQA